MKYSDDDSPALDCLLILVGNAQCVHALIWVRSGVIETLVNHVFTWQIPVQLIILLSKRNKTRFLHLRQVKCIVLMSYIDQITVQQTCTITPIILLFPFLTLV